jgi:hypothetical protein
MFALPDSAGIINCIELNSIRKTYSQDQHRLLEFMIMRLIDDGYGLPGTTKFLKNEDIIFLLI